MRDVTARYRQALGSPDTEADVAKRLRDAVVLFVRGFLSDAIVDLGARLAAAAAGLAPVTGRRPGPAIGMGEYFDAQMRWLTGLEVRHERLDIESEAPVRDNATIVLGRVESWAETVPRVFVVSHSKGCLDTLEALLAAPGAVRQRIAGWVAIQGPFAGSPVADGVAAHPDLRHIASTVLAGAGGSIQSIDEMRTGARVEHLAEHAAGIAALLETVPTVCLATAARPDPFATSLAPTVAFIEAAKGGGGANDGLVTRESATLPGARFVALDGVDHAMPVMPGVLPFDRVASTQALLGIV